MQMKSLIDFLYPSRCPFCDNLLKSNNPTDNINSNSIISNINSKKPYNTTLEIANSFLCSDCRAKVRLLGDFSILGMDTFSTQYCDGMIAAFEYRGIVRKGISNMKFHDRASAGKAFGAFLAERLKHTKDIPPISKYDLIIPIPMFRSREAERGYNQAAILAKELCIQLGRSSSENILLKRKNTAKQGKSSGVDRQINISGAYTVAESDKQPVSGKCILLIDDIITTGNTINEAAKALKQSGAASVFALAFAAGRSELTNGMR